MHEDIKSQLPGHRLVTEILNNQAAVNGLTDQVSQPYPIATYIANGWL